MRHEDTIAAISTPAGEGGIGIVRLSGAEALEIAEAAFAPAARDLSLSRTLSHTIHYGHIIRNGEVIDEVLLTVMRAPRTYTREDTVEINCHGGIIPLRKTLSLLLDLGARPAAPGEFTQRAFLGGRIDLSQAEAAADLIRARTEMAGKVALSQLKGDLRDKVERISSGITSILAEVEAAIEFPDEVSGNSRGIGPGIEINALCEEIDELIATYSFGRIAREGFNVAVVGLPNAGKSSIFNALIGEDRVIVTPVAGTTRDVIEASIDIDGIQIILADTAGIGGVSKDIVEKAAVVRSAQRAESADAVLHVIDGSAESTSKDILLSAKLRHKPSVIAVNKTDLPRKVPSLAIREIAGRQGRVVETSAKTNYGIKELKISLAALVWGGTAPPRESLVISSERHAAALKRARLALLEAAGAADEFGDEIVAFNLRLGLDAMGEITGKTACEEILSQIFSKFCIGK